MEGSEEVDRRTRPVFVRSQADSVLLSDRVLANLLVSESHYAFKVSDYMAQVQRSLAVNHRKIVTDWMLEVCQESNLAPQVFLSSVTYLDTVLAQMSLPPSQLQLLASACLSLASKLSDPRPLSLYKLVVATDCSCSLAELQAMEMVVLQKLQWELSSPSPLHFLSLLLAQLDTRLSAALLRLVEKQAETFLMLAATEYKFYSVRPSIMASAAILASVEQLVGSCPPDLVTQLSEIVRMHQHYLRQAVAQLRVHVQEWVALPQEAGPGQQLGGGKLSDMEHFMEIVS